jgi:hypothetical protein
MQNDGMNAVERTRSEAPGDEFLFLDVEERDKAPLDWHHRESLANREGERAFFRVGLWGILGGVCASLISESFFGKALLGPVLPVLHPPYTEYVAFGLLSVFLTGLIVGKRRRYGILVPRIRVHDGLFEIVLGNGETEARIPADRVRTVAVRESAFGAKHCSMTLVGVDGRRHTIRHLSDMPRVGAFAEFCRHAHIGCDYGKDSPVKSALGHGIGMALMLLLIASSPPLDPTTDFSLVILVLLYGLYYKT